MHGRGTRHACSACRDQATGRGRRISSRACRGLRDLSALAYSSNMRMDRVPISLARTREKEIKENAVLAPAVIYSRAQVESNVALLLSV